MAGYVCTPLINELSGLLTSTTCPWNIKRSTTAWRWFVKKKNHNIVTIKSIWCCWKNRHLHKVLHPCFLIPWLHKRKLTSGTTLGWTSFPWDSPKKFQQTHHHHHHSQSRLRFCPRNWASAAPRLARPCTRWSRTWTRSQEHWNRCAGLEPQSAVVIMMM